jgi:hypothetical protein
MFKNSSKPDHYKAHREGIRRKLDQLCEIHDQLAANDARRAQILDQIRALNIAYNLED